MEGGILLGPFIIGNTILDLLQDINELQDALNNLSEGINTIVSNLSRNPREYY